MINQPAISIIIPVYGVEKYIAKCLESIKQQTFEDFECLVVDDGTPDNSIKLAKEVVGNDPRFIFLQKKNGGLASARNFGLDHAKGNFIAFVDSDDWVESTFLEEPYRKIIESDADICIFGLSFVDEKGNELSRRLPNINNYLNKRDYLLSIAGGLELVSVTKLYKKKSLNELRFDEMTITYEDVTFSIEALFNKKIVQIESVLYHYVQRLGSLSKGINPTFINDRLRIVQFHEEFIKRNKIKSLTDNYLLYSYLKVFVFHAIVKLSRYSNNYSEDIKALKREINPTRFTYKNIFFMVKKEKKAGLSLLLFKLSPSAFRLFARFWFRNHAA